MTLPRPAPAPADPATAARHLRSGDILTLALPAPQPAVLSLGSMAARERMLLRIPLAPDLMDAGDWDCLPGIGPVLAARIVADRHKNGAFGSPEALGRVPGVGPGKLRAIRKYF